MMSGVVKVLFNRCRREERAETGKGERGGRVYVYVYVYVYA